jgi:8-oxo-dGTP pyrophosphatase MutT (NUDIX family)
MWMIGRDGFVSIVQKPGDAAKGQLTLRARVRADLEALRSSVLPELSAIAAHVGSDYPYRATAPRESVANAMAECVRKIDYANFKKAVAQEHGHARAAVYGDVWHALLGLEQLPVQGTAKAPALSIPKADAYGGVLMDAEGRVLLREPANHFGGYTWTFAKGRPDPGESPVEAALREVREETGYVAEIRGLIPGVFAGTTTTTVMLLLQAVGAPEAFDQKETWQVRWFAPDEAAEAIAQSASETGRARDLAILKAACAAWAQMKFPP